MGKEEMALWRRGEEEGNIEKVDEYEGGEYGNGDIGMREG